MRDILITNNEPVVEAFKNACGIDFVEGDLKTVLQKTRDYIHKGHSLLTHPMSGSVKPNENPFKSILVTQKAKNETDQDSLRIIENAIAAAQKFPPKYKFLSEQMKKDFSAVDLSLIKSTGLI